MTRRTDIDDVLAQLDVVMECYTRRPPTAGVKMIRELRLEMDKLSILMLRYRMEKDGYA
jgi:hypothetical protein